MRHISDMHYAVDVVGSHANRPFADLVSHFLRRSYGNEEGVADGVEIEASMQLVRARRTDLQLICREVSRRRQPLRRTAGVILEEMLQVMDVFPLRLLLSFRHVDEIQQRQLVGPDTVSIVRRAFTEALIEFERS